MAALTTLIVLLSQFAFIQLVPVDSVALRLDEEAQRIDESLENFSQKTTNPDAEVFETTADNSELRAKRQLLDNEYDAELFSTAADDDSGNNIGDTMKKSITVAKTTAKDQMPTVKPVTGAFKFVSTSTMALFKSIQTTLKHGTARLGAITSPGTRTTTKIGIPSQRPSTSVGPSARNGVDGVRTTQKVGSIYFPIKWNVLRRDLLEAEIKFRTQFCNKWAPFKLEMFMVELKWRT